MPRPLVTFVTALDKSTVVSRPEEAVPLPSCPLIGTHDGTFHCDEACAVAMLKMLPAYEHSVVVRSRDPAVLAGCDVVVDVGAVYEPARHRYDHHQRGFDEVMGELGHTTKLSSFGLVYRHFGAEFIRRVAAAADGAGAAGDGPASLDLGAIYRKVYKSFVEHIDGIDNGVEAFDSDSRNYEVTTTLSSRVAALNPSWNEPMGPEDLNARFALALALVGAEMAACVEDCIRSWWPARAIVAAALEDAAAVHPSRQILVLQRYCPWAAHLFELEDERTVAGDSGAAGAAKYVIFKDAKGPDWRIHAVPITEVSFTSRRALPESWRGLRDQQLSDHVGAEGCVFVHATGFVGGNKSKEGALAMALKAVSD